VIEAVAKTFAPFIGAEKPQLFPWAGASLIRGDRQIGEPGVRIAGYRAARRNPGVNHKISVVPILIGFLTSLQRSYRTAIGRQNRPLPSLYTEPKSCPCSKQG
jgi:hypothetical protein